MPIGRKPQGIAEKTQLIVPDGEPGVLVLGDAVALTSDGAVRANAIDLSRMPASGVVTSLYNDGQINVATILTNGETTIPNLVVTGGESFYLHPTNPGKLTSTKPTKDDFPGGVGRIQLIAVGLGAPDKTLIQVEASPENAFPPTATGTIIIQDDGSTVVTEANLLDFTGTGIGAASGGANEAVITSNNPVFVEVVTSGSDAIFQYAPVSSIEGSDRVQNASSDPSRASFIGVSTNSTHVINESIIVQVAGETPVRFNAAPATLDNGKRVFLSAVAGEPTLVVPSNQGEMLVQIGILSGADGVSTNPTVLLLPSTVVQL